MHILKHHKALLTSLLASVAIAGCTTTNLQRGEQEGARGDYASMLKWCEEASREPNANPRAFKCVGDAHARLGHRGRAEKAYLTYLDMVPGDSDTRMALVRLYYDDGKYKPALAQAEKVVETDPANYEAYFYMGEIHRMDKSCTPARKAYKRALEINPEYMQAKAGMEKLNKICRKPSRPPKVKKERKMKGGGKALREGQW